MVQVSMNLTDFMQTPLATLFERVYREAQKRGCTVSGTEIVGLVPRSALEEGPGAFLPEISQQQILENRLASVFPQRESNGQERKSILMKGAAR